MTLVILTSIFNIQLARSEPKTLIVPDDSATIQGAVNAAYPGDRIIVKPGIYFERVIVNKSDLMIVGQDRDLVIVDGGGKGPIIKITANNITFSNFTLRRSGSYSGLDVLNYASVTYNEVLRCKVGISVSSKSFVGYNFVSNSGQGILLHYCSNVTVERNNISLCTEGITLSGTQDTQVVNNTIMRSSEGGHGITILSSYDNLVYGNLVWNNSHGIWLSGSFNNSIVGNTIAKNSILGIELTDATNNTIYHNNFIDNKKHVTTNTVNKWDDGYPVGGNFWIDYKSKYADSKDEYSGPYQNQLGSDGIWDNPYQIVGENLDRYPLVRPFGKIPDSTPPRTVYKYDGLWHNRDYVVELTASDDLSGVEETYYMVNNASTPRKVSVDGQPVIDVEGANNTVEFWSVDYMGNEEEHNVLAGVKLDKTPPVADAGRNRTVEVGTFVTFNANASFDELSGISKYRWDLGNGVIRFERKFVYNFSEPGTYKVTLKVYDTAGNHATDTIFVTVVAYGNLPRIVFPISAIIVIVTVLAVLMLRRLKRQKIKRISRKWNKK